MGLRKVFETPVDYREGESCYFASGGGAGEGGIADTRYWDAKFGPWLTKEEIIPGLRPGWLWFADQQRTVLKQDGETRSIPNGICFGANVNQMCWPSWNVTMWIFNGRTGEKFQRLAQGESWEEPDADTFYDLMPPDANGGGLRTAMFDHFASVDASGLLWQFGNTTPIWWSHAAVQRDPFTLDLTGRYIDAFPDHYGVTHGSISDMAYDSVAKILWVRWFGDVTGRVEVWSYDIANPAGRTWLHDIYTPNETNGLSLTSDGYIFAADSKDWVVLYDYDGRYHSAFIEPRPASCPNGVTWAWDRIYKRLLRVAGTPSDPTTGRSTMKVEGFFPIPANDSLTAPIPRKVPRKNRRITVLSRLVGEGCEAIGSAPIFVKVNTVSVTTSRTDGDGDAIIPITPAATGAITVEVSTP